MWQDNYLYGEFSETPFTYLFSRTDRAFSRLQTSAILNQTACLEETFALSLAKTTTATLGVTL